MPSLKSVRSVLAVQDLDASIAFFCEKLGFTSEFTVDGWCFLSRGGFALMLGHCPDEIPAGRTGDHSYFAYVTVDDIDSLHEEFRVRKVTAMTEAESKPWGMREFLITTPDGHRIMFGQDLEPSDSEAGEDAAEPVAAADGFAAR